MTTRPRCPQLQLPGVDGWACKINAQVAAPRGAWPHLPASHSTAGRVLAWPVGPQLPSPPPPRPHARSFPPPLVRAVTPASSGPFSAQLLMLLSAVVQQEGSACVPCARVPVLLPSPALLCVLTCALRFYITRSPVFLAVRFLRLISCTASTTRHHSVPTHGFDSISKVPLTHCGRQGCTVARLQLTVLVKLGAKCLGRVERLLGRQQGGTRLERV